MGARLAVIMQREPARGRCSLQPREAAVACEAVLRHGVVVATMAQDVALQTTDDRKQHGRMTRPDWPGLPEQLLILGVAQRA